MPVTVPPPVGLGHDTRTRRSAREALVDVLWDGQGRRRLPRDKELATAMEACDRRDVWWVCEASSAGPVYLLPTREWIGALAKWIDDSGAKSVLEVAAGDGFLARCLARARPQLRVTASDNHAWSKARARMNARDVRERGRVPFAGINFGDGDGVVRLAAASAVDVHRPDLVIVSWAPPGTLVERVIRAKRARLVLDIGVDGDVCGNGDKTWRFEKDFLDGPLEDKALCRLDERPLHEPRRTRVTLYYGKADPRFRDPRHPRQR